MTNRPAPSFPLVTEPAYRKGDLVYIRAIVAEDGPNPSGFVSFITFSRPEGPIRYFKPADILLVEPRPLAVGDRVRLKDYPPVALVVRLVQGEQVVCAGQDTLTIYYAVELERLP